MESGINIIRCADFFALLLILLFMLACTAQSNNSATFHASDNGNSTSPTPADGTSKSEVKNDSGSNDTSPCSNAPSLCEAYWLSRVVFTGRVVSISPNGQPKVRFLVTKTYRGRLNPEATVRTLRGDARPRYEFKEGETYLVYAKADKGYENLTVEECSGTKLLSAAEEDIKYIQSLSNPNPEILEVEGGLRAISKPPPSYPKEAKDAGISGSVYVKITVDETGKVISAQGVCGPAELVASAEKAIRNWQFEPTQVSGKAVKIRTIVRSTFTP